MSTVIKPFKGNYKLSQDFGNKLYIADPKSTLYIAGKEDYYARYNLLGHNGEDFSMPIGTPLIASISGTVIEATYEPGGYGWYIHIENDEYGVLTGHMDSLSVSNQAIVKQGDLIGYSGNSGGSTGPHVHFGFYTKPRNRSNGYNGYIDPTPYFAAIGGTTMIDTQLPVLNTYGLDDTNIQSKQVVYDAWHDLTSGKYMPKDEFDRLLNEANQKTQEALKQVEDTKNSFNDKFAFLGQLNDIGLHTIDDVTTPLNKYGDMYKAGFPNLESIQARIVGIQLQLEDKDKTITKQQDQITELQQAVIKAQETSAPMILEITDLKTKLSDYEKRIPLLNPKSVINKLAQVLELLKKLFPNNKVVQSIKPEQVQATINEFDQFSHAVGITTNTQER